MAHLRIPLDRAIELARAIGSCGRISGRAKPLVAVMTDIGKIVLYEGVIVGRDGRRVLLKSQYRAEERRRWNRTRRRRARVAF
jgi:lysine 2,3-aminomutase